LGLAIAAALSRRNSGHITAANHPEGRAVLTLTLPLAAHQNPRRQER
jgi:signal transduction histidine kinase